MAPQQVQEHHVPPKVVAKATLVIILIWALANLLWLGREVLFVAYFGILVGVFLTFFVEKLADRGVPRLLAAAGVWMLSLLLLTGLLGALWPLLQDQFSIIREQLPQALTRVSSWFEEQYRAVAGEMGAPDSQIEEEVRLRFGQEAASMIAGALPLLNTVVGALTGVAVVLVSGLFIAVDPKLYRHGLERLFPPRSRSLIKRTFAELGHTLRWWMVGTFISMFIIAVMTTIGLWLLDIPVALALGLIAGLLQFIPMFGPILSAVPAVGIALIISPTAVLYVILLYIGIQLVESNFITPLVMKEAVQLPPALTILFQSLMAVIFGFLGLLLAVPILAAGIVLVRMLYVERMERGSGTAAAEAG